METIRAFDGGEFQGYLAVPPSGRGPGIVLMQEIFGINQVMRDVADQYAAHGFTVICPDLFWRQEPGVVLTDRTEKEWERAFELYNGLDEAKAVEDSAAALAFLRGHPACTGKIGGVGFCLGGKLAYLLAARFDPDAAVGYYGVGIEKALEEAEGITAPLLLHLAGEDQFCPPEARAAIHTALDSHPRATLHDYPGNNHAFARPGGEHHDPAAAELADLRSMEFFVRHLVGGRGPDLSALWDEHVNCEFTTRDAEDTLETMVEDAYVNHVPTLTGGVGREALREFYSKRFIPQMPPDTAMTPVSRTVGPDRVVDEMVFSFTHTIEMDWMLPGVAPTGKKVDVPLIAVVHFRGGKLAHEHIYWDQASVLVQLDLLDAGSLPVAGAETARKVLDPGLPANALIERADRLKKK
ncbi:MAG: dienelactone hydrolase family protein [Acidobacteriota bacterium]